MYHYKKKPRKNNLLWLGILLVLGSIIFTVYYSEFFERESPSITAPDDIYWNLKQPIKVSLSDNRGIRSYKVSLIKQDAAITLAKGKADSERYIDLDINFPAKTFYPKGDTRLKVEVTDTSFWNFASGNTVQKISNIIVDRRKPEVDIISKSYGITLGGTAIVIFEVEDDNLEDIAITTNNNDEFQVIPFYKEGYYISLIARDLRSRGFRAYIEATDKAGNKNRKRIPFFNKNKRYKISKIPLRSAFLNGKITDLYSETFANEPYEEDSLKRFIKINETLRQKNSDLITSYTKNILEDRISDFTLQTFEPLKNYSAVASFGDHRYFYSEKEEVSQSYHLGLDLANIQHGDIFSSNKGKVIYSAKNGIYGNMPIIYHGLGLYSVYGHCNELLVSDGMDVEAGQIIATTGKSGLALGDHLHFELRVQGVPVRPAEYMDKKWMQQNIFKPIEKAKEIIDTKL